MPIAAILGRAEVMDAAAPGTIGGTYIGNPVSCAAALATIQYMKDENLNQRAVEVGNIITARFEKLKQLYTDIGDVRGVGAMVAIEFVKDGDSRKPAPEICHAVVDGCAAHGLILISAGTFKNIIRVLCPLVISNEQLDRGLDIIEQEIEHAIRKEL